MNSFRKRVFIRAGKHTTVHVEHPHIMFMFMPMRVYVWIYTQIIKIAMNIAEHKEIINKTKIW